LFIGGTDVKDNCDIFEKSGAQVWISLIIFFYQTV
jgi:hypothetical protein